MFERSRDGSGGSEGAPGNFAGVCFDLYSTLIHESPDNPFYAQVAGSLGLDFARWLPAYRGRGADAMSGRLAGMAERVLAAAVDVGSPRPAEEVRAAVARAFPRFVDSVTADPQAWPLLTLLRDRGVRLALVSNASAYSEDVLDHLGLREVFDSVVLSYRVGLLKPEPGIYRLALAELGLAAADCAFVGDGGDRELRGARAVGLRTVLVDRGLAHSPDAAADADAVVRELAGVRELVLGTRLGA